MDEAKKKFSQFESLSSKGVHSNNPVYSTLEGNNYAKEGKHSQALNKYKEAIKQDNVFSVPAMYNSAMTKVSQIGESVLR